MKKKLFGIILVCALVLTLLPLSAFAGAGDGILLNYYDAKTLKKIDGLFSEYDFTEMREWPFVFEQPDGTSIPGDCYYPELSLSLFGIRADISQIGTHKLTSFPIPDGYEAVKVFELKWAEGEIKNSMDITSDNVGEDDFTITEEDMEDYEFLTKYIGVLLQPIEAPETPSAWAVEQVNAAIAAGLTPEELQSNYTAATTRAEFCALAVRLYESLKGEITDRSTFIDTEDANVEKAAAVDVVNGVGDNKFDPDAKLTREQAATMLSRLAEALDKPLPVNAPGFNDDAEVSPWAVDAVGQMQATGIMGGVGNNTFAPKSDYTREQSIITIMRLFDIVK